MLRMESHRSENSLNFSERESPAWVKLWSANYSSTGGLNIGENGSDSDLAAAIGDKEVAAKAVAFVVNSTRKGIVPLCADVANLLRAKRSLEDRVLQLSKENDSLRLASDERESLTGSTVTRSKHAEQTDSSYPSNEQNGSVCSYHSTSPVNQINGSCQQLDTSSPLVPKANRNPDCMTDTGTIITPHDVVNLSQDEACSTSTDDDAGAPVSAPQHCFVPVTPAGKVSPRLTSKLIVHPIPSDHELLTNSKGGNIVEAEVHVSPDSNTTWQGRTWARRQHHRTPSLSSSEHSSNRSLELNSYEDKQPSISTVSRQLSKTIVANNKLTEELNAARATIEKLQKEVRDFRAFCKNSNQEGCEGANYPRSRRQSSAPDVLPVQQKLPADGDFPLRASLTSCQVCAEVQRSARVNGAITPRLFKHDAITLFTSENMLVNIDDSILTCNAQCGTVRFIGHLDGIAPSSLFVGVQLAEKVNSGLDGSFNGKRYFSCPKGRGIFIQAQDIVNVISKKQASVIHKSKKPNIMSSTEDSPPSSSSSMSTGGFVNKLRKVAVTIRHTHSHKRISLPASTSTLAATDRQSDQQFNNQPIITSNVHQRQSCSVVAKLPEGLV